MPRLSKIGAAALAAFGWTSGVSAVTATYLVVAGGGGGGGAGDTPAGGGGGAGGLLSGTASLNPTLSYTITVGAAGAGGSSTTVGGNGANSVFGSIATATGGGGGGTYGYGGGQNGGSGGGAAWPTSYSAGTGTVGQGNNGGKNTTSGASQGGGGGGGSNAAGTSVSGNDGGAGGGGTANSITGSSVTYAGGGGGGAGAGNYPTYGTGGTATGGGGAGGNSSSTGSNGSAGTANLGGGGGGAGGSGPSPYTARSGGNGGSGVVIISYPAPQKFSGGVVTLSGGNVIHTFTTSGTLGPITTLSASYLIVAGGASGGNGNANIRVYGGGGAGGMLTGSGLTIDPNSTYIVTVGAGGASQTVANTVGYNGSNSSFSAVATTAVGGGNAGSFQSGNGGSGGGGGYDGSLYSPGSGTAGQGNNGGTGTTTGGGGGGGAGAVGGNASGGTGGVGGAGSASSISGTSTYYAGGGGGGGASSNGAGGVGGGGSGSTAGTANTGGGGGGTATNITSGAGGSGIVIISYPGSTQQMAGGTVTITGGNVIHTFTSTGYLAPLKYVGNSLRFRASASAYLSRTPSVAGNTKTFTYSAWVKRGSLGSIQNLISSPSSGNSDSLRFSAADQLEYNWQDTVVGQVTTTQVFRDPAAWYHIAFAMDTTQATASNRFKLYVNGVQVTAFATANYPAQNTVVNNTGAVATKLGQYANSSAQSFDGYMAEVNLVDGQALTPSSFGTFNSYGVWQPITYGGSYGTNGFYLPFNAQTSSYAGSFNGSNQYLSSTVGSSTIGSGDFTVEFYINSTSGTDARVFSLGNNNATGSLHIIYTGTYMRVNWATTGGATGTRQVSGGGWHHYALVRSSNTLKSYVDGVLDVNYGTVTDNFNLTALQIAANSALPSYFAGYLSNFRITTSALYTANFTPPTSALSAVSGTTYLTLQNASIVDNSTNAYSITNNNGVTTGQTYPFAYGIFNDQGPAGNNWTPNNVSGAFGTTLDYMTDVPTLTSATAANYAVLNPLFAAGTVSDGNLKHTASTTTWVNTSSTIFVSSGKWYFEATNIAGNYTMIGVATNSASTSQNYATATNTWTYFNDGTKYGNGATATAYGASYTTGNVIGVALDMDAGTLTFYKDGVSQGTAFSTGLAGLSLCPWFGSYTSGNGVNVNFGQRPFSQTVPTGFKALNTFNL